MADERRHLQHIRTTHLQYVQISNGDIPVYASVRTMLDVPSQHDIENMESPPMYIKVSSNGNYKYYELNGKQPSDLRFGEIGISYKDGHERIYIKNASGKIVEFRPYSVDVNSAYMFQKDNEQLTPSVDDVCTWEIGYNELRNKGVSPNCASVALRHIESGKQTVPDVVFDNENNLLKIFIYSETDIAAGEYRVIITGLNYGE